MELTEKPRGTDHSPSFQLLSHEPEALLCLQPPILLSMDPLTFSAQFVLLACLRILAFGSSPILTLNEAFIVGRLASLRSSCSI